MNNFLDLSGLSKFLDLLRITFANKDIATSSSDGLLSANDKNKLDGFVFEFDNKVPITRTINGKELSEDIILTANDVGSDISGSAEYALSEAKAYTDGEIANLIGSAPETKNTLEELAIAIEENEEVVDILNTAIGNKAPISHTHTSSEITDLFSVIFEKFYPVGSIYFSTVSTNPKTLFGFGTWTQIKDVFLLAAGSTYSAGATGGSSTHSHRYGMILAAYCGALVGEGSANVGVLKNGTGSAAGLSTQSGDATNTINGSFTTSSKSTSTTHYKSTASTSSTSTLPPYLVVYVWKRTA